MVIAGQTPDSVLDRGKHHNYFYIPNVAHVPDVEIAKQTMFDAQSATGQQRQTFS